MLTSTDLQRLVADTDVAACLGAIACFILSPWDGSALAKGDRSVSGAAIGTDCHTLQAASFSPSD
jgi:hypothetical protein